MKITIAQLDPTVGDLAGNLARLKEAYLAAPPDSDLVVASELYLVGYPPKDLLERAWFIERVQETLAEVRRLTSSRPQIGLLVGAPVPNGDAHGKGLRNAALLIQAGHLVASSYKALLPTYDVFDEERYFDPATSVQVVSFKGERLGIHICEDAWTDPALWGPRELYEFDPVEALAAQGATVFINLSASPYSVGKERIRYQLISQHARRHRTPFIYVNQVGGNDELIFDGRSLAVDTAGNPLAVLASFCEELRTVDTAAQGSSEPYLPQEEIASVHDALVLGLRDYMHKCGFKQALVGLSGGIDSSVTFALAARAVGVENILGVSMPSPYSSEGSIADARQLAENLGARFELVPITGIFEGYLAALQGAFHGAPPNVAEENIQARIRGNIVMALSNKFGHLLLTTGNKSELAVGYCTLYGDMSGGLAVISDVPKTMIYALAEYINRDGAPIPLDCITKPPSAELRPNQTDQDTLPPYPVLDGILRLYIEEGYSREQLVAAGYAPEVVRWVVRTVDLNEYKRRQAAPGLRVTTKAFGIGRRMPIAARYPHDPIRSESAR